MSVLLEDAYPSRKKSLEQALGPRFLTEDRKLNSWNSFIDFLENYDSDPGSLDLETVEVQTASRLGQTFSSVMGLGLWA